jgi:hypothetical protein
LLRKMINNSNICGLFIICQYSFFEGDRKWFTDTASCY